MYLLLERRALDLLRQALAIDTRIIAIDSKELPESLVLTLEVLLLIWNQEP